MRSILLPLVILMSSISYAQVTVNWVNYPGGVALATDASNNVYTANWDYNAGGDITLTKRNVAGTIIWEVPYDNTDMTRHEVATWVATDQAGNILVSGTIRSGYSNPVNAASILMKYDPSGNLLWRRVYESEFEGSSTKKCLIDANNNIYVLGLGQSGTGMVTRVKKFDAAGTALWSYFDNAGIGAPMNFKFTPDQKILIISRGLTGSINGFTKMDLDGNIIWTLAGNYSYSAGDAAGDASGNTYLINGEYVISNAGSIIKKISPAGTVIWSQTNIIGGTKVEVGTDNNPIISGYPPVGYGAAFMKYDNNGNVLWQNLDADGPAYALLTHAQLRLDGNNAAYLAASTLFQMAVCKVYSNGTSAWLATTSGSAAYALAFGTDSSIFVTGGTTARLTQELIALPVKLINFAARKLENQVIIKWESAEELNLSHYILQYSEDGTRFNDISNITAKGSNSSYTYTDINRPAATHIYYRLQSVDIDGKTRLSAVVHLVNDMNSAVTKLTVYPNPVQQAIHTSFVTDKNMQVVFSLFSLNGKLLQTYLRTASPGSNFYQLDLSSGLPAGSYILSADYGEGNSIQTKIIKQ
jgi:hypothetical protein